MLKSEIRLLAPVQAEVTESPLWDARQRKLHFVDIYGPRILSLDWASGAVSQIDTPEPVACLGLSGDGHFIAGLKSGTALIERASGKITPLGNFSIAPDSRLNDGRCGPDGRYFWVGSMVEKLDRAGGHLLRVAPDGRIETMASDLICSNGLAWSADGRTMYHSDSRQRTVWIYDYDIETGAIANKRIFCVAPEGEGRPDGAAVDSEGCYWSARYDGWRIVRHAPDGSELFILRTPVQKPTMCAFAGDDLSTLVFTSARGSLAGAELERQPLAGSVFAVDVGVAGCPDPDFRANA
jgi:sugar lactone lactonase YvrE